MYEDIVTKSTDAAEISSQLSRVLNPLTLDLFVDQGFAVIDHLLPESVSADLLKLSRKLLSSGQMQPAKVGRAQNQSSQKDIRNDSIFWLEENFISSEPSLCSWLNYRQQLMTYLNQNLYLGLNSFEGHLAHYSPGQKYDRHIDQSPHHSPLHGERVISWITYLNPHWTADDGGELCLFLQQGEAEKTQLIEPRWGRSILFFAQKIPHSVLAAKAERWSLTGWFRRF